MDRKSAEASRATTARGAWGVFDFERPGSGCRIAPRCPVYEALGLDWDPATSGSVAAELGREVELDEVVEALVAGLDRDNVVTEAELDEETLALASRLLED